MVRYTTKRAGLSSDNLLVGLVIALAVILFFAIVLWPSGSKPGAPLQSASATPLAKELNDATTIQYLTVLQRVEPAMAGELYRQADAAIVSGAGKDELALLVLAALGDDLNNAQNVWLKADVEYFDNVLNVTKAGLTRLSRHAPKYCHTAHYESLMTSEHEDVLTELLSLLSYDSAGYKFALEINQVLLEGIEDGRKSPNKYSRLNAADERAAQMMVMGLMSNPKISNAMRIQSLPPAEQKRAMATLNVCDLSSDVIAGVLGLPQDTKKRLMGEMTHMAESGKLAESMQTMANGF